MAEELREIELEIVVHTNKKSVRYHRVVHSSEELQEEIDKVKDGLNAQ